MSKERIAVAMSGGVDSSVAAALLVEAGHDVVGLTMKLWACKGQDADPSKFRGDTCCSPQDILDAKAVCRRLGIRHYVLEMTERFESLVVEPWISSYMEGRTPNPCVWCNERVKSKDLVDRARELGATALATGHYARIGTDPETGRYVLQRAEDNLKDQTYFLFPLTQDELAYLRFPIGDIQDKRNVRETAERIGLNVAQKNDSYEICFVRSGDHREFLSRNVPDAFRPGKVLSTDGRVLGEHNGAVGYTIGQRRGLGIGGLTEPHFIVHVDTNKNEVILGTEDHLFQSMFDVHDMYWLKYDKPPEQFRCNARIRYRSPAAPATVEVIGERRVRICFDQPQRAITPGQACVLYDGDTVVGGGWIHNVAFQPQPASVQAGFRV